MTGPDPRDRDDPEADAAPAAGDPPGATPRRRRLAWAAAAVAVVAIGALALTQGGSPDTAPGERGGLAPAFRLDNLQSGQPPVDLEALRGKPVIVNFWASWCTPCRREMPAFAEISEALGDRVAFVGVNNKDFRDSAVDFADKTGIRYPSGFDPKGRVALDYGVVGMPATMFISPDGRLLERRLGEISRDELQQTISRLYGIS